jgi:acyl-[acyl-carrier-protein] desaturase
LIATDERAHHAFYKDVVLTFLEIDRHATLKELEGCLHHFSMPATHLIPEGIRRQAAVHALHVFDEEIYFRDVYSPILAALDVKKCELKSFSKKSTACTREMSWALA